MSFINVIETPSVDSFDYLLFPDQNPFNQVYIQNQFSNFSNTLTDIGKKFMETSQAIYQKVNDSNAIRLAKAAVRMAKGIFHPNVILSLETLEDLRAAQPIMQRYIMAQPDLRRIYLDQKCDGYSDTYSNIEGSAIGEDHYDYRRVMTGVIRELETDDGFDWVSRNYLEDLHPDDKELTHDERVCILKTWDVVEMFVKSSQDPTDIFAS